MLQEAKGEKKLPDCLKRHSKLLSLLIMKWRPSWFMYHSILHREMRQLPARHWRSVDECIWKKLQWSVICTNYNYIVQVLDNLLGNAPRFTHEGYVTLAYEVKKEENQLILRLQIPESVFPLRNRNVFLSALWSWIILVRGQGSVCPFAVLLPKGWVSTWGLIKGTLKVPVLFSVCWCEE